MDCGKASKCEIGSYEKLDTYSNRRLDIPELALQSRRGHGSKEDKADTTLLLSNTL